MRNKIIVYISFLLVFSACAKKSYLADISSRNYRIEKGSHSNDVAISNMISPYKEKLDLVMNEIIGYNPVEMTKGKPNSSLTNWFADALWEEVNEQQGLAVDFAIQNYGGVRQNAMAKGNITIGTIYELMPFDNTMFVVTLNGEEVQLLMDKLADSGGWPLSRSVQFTMEFGKAVDIKINGKPLDSKAEYKAAIPDYVAQGGDNTTFLQNCPRLETQILVRDLLIQHVKRKTAKGEQIISDPTQRIL